MYKIVAVDMDSTFLDDEKKYNKKKFKELLKLMEKHGIHFVVASGNQYFQLKSFFIGLDPFISYVSENGARVVYQGSELFCAEIGHEDLIQTINIIKDFECEMIVCGRLSAYILKDADQWWHDYVAIYNHKVTEIDDFEDLVNHNDIYFKFALQFQSAEEKDAALILLKDMLPKNLTPVVTAERSIDLIFKDYTKAYGLQVLVERLELTSEDVIAFGDNGNDMEMIAYAGHGVAVANSVKELKEIADEVIGDNNDDTVIDYLLDYYRQF